jgi:hypothetical protein
MKKTAGLIPIGGNASRMKKLPKFLLPCKEETTLLEHTIDHFQKNGINKIRLGVSKLNKTFTELYEHEKVVVNTSTMTETICEILRPEDEKNIMIMPDTYFTLKDELIRMENMLDNYNVVVLLWKIADYQKGKLGQCEIYKDEVVNVRDKDKDCMYEYFWGVIGWTKNMNVFIDPSWSTIGCLISKTIDLNLEVGYIIMEDSTYYDCGTFSEYFKMIYDTTQ